MTLLMRCKAAAKIVRRTDVDVAVAQLKEINVPQAANSPPVGLGWPATRSPTGRRVAEREGLPHSFNECNKIRGLSFARTSRVYQSCVPRSTRFALPTAPKCIQIRCTDLITPAISV